MQYLSLFHLIRPHVNFFLRFLLLFVEYANEIGMKRSEIKFQRYIGKRTHKEKRERERISMTTYTQFAKKELTAEEEEEHYLQFNLTYDDFVLQFVPIMLKLWII